VLSSRVANACFPEREGTPTFLNGIGNQPVPARILKDVPISIGDTSFTTTFFVADISDDLLLGIDFLKNLEVTVNFATNEVVMGSQIIVASCIKEENNKSKARQVRLVGRTRVPSNSTVFTIGQLSAPSKNTFLVTPARNATPCLMPTSVHSKGSLAAIQLVNDTDSLIYVEAGTVVGTATKASVLEPGQKGVRKVRKTRHLPRSASIPSHLVDLFERSSEGLSPQQKEDLKRLLIEYADVFATHDLDLGCFSAIPHRIEVLPGSSPIRDRMRRTPKGFEEEEEKHLEQLLAAGVIQPSVSPWAASPVLVRKKCGGVRWCLDYRRLNSVCKKDAFPLPLISDCLDSLSENIFMSTLDMASGYYQISIHPDDREKTAFITRYGLFEHTRMSFGLCNAPSTFQRAMSLVLRGLTWTKVLAFLDDVLVLGRSFDDHLLNLEEVLSRFRQHSLKLKPKKCALFRRKAKFLGKIVSGDSIEADPESIAAVKNWPLPQKTRDVESFLGFVNYHREHISHFADLAAPLYSLTGKAPFVWTDEQTEAFERLKQVMLSPAVLGMPRSEGMFILDTDASNLAVAGQLSQIQGDQVKPIAFASKRLTPTQRKYCVTRKELLAILTFVRQFRHYLLGRKFLIRTDHNSLAWLTRFKNPDGQLARWLEELSQFNMEVSHRPGKQHANADALSRIPDTLTTCNCYSAGKRVEDLPCGGCPTCSRAHNQWERFEEDVDDIAPLAHSADFPQVLATALQTNWADSLSPQEKRDEQEKDPCLGTVISWLKNKTQPSQEELSSQAPEVKILWAHRQLLRLENNILVYLWHDKVEERQLFVVPTSLRAKMLGLAHENVMSGHLGMDKTKERLRQVCYWTSQSADIRQHILACSACQMNKHLRQRPKAPLRSYTAGAPMEKVHMDILGPLPKSHKGNSYVLLMVDQFTKWVEAVALPDQTAETIAKAAVDNFFSRFGCPKEICTDQGSNFNSRLFQSLCHRLEITKKRTTPYHPSANGQVERMNRNVLQMIRCTLEGGQQNWDDKLQLLMGALRSSTNRTTGYTPNRLMIGRETQLPLHLMAGVEGNQACEPDYVSQLEHSLQEAHELTRKNIQSEQARQKREHDHHTVVSHYEVGDAVMLANSATKIGQSKKLQPMWTGPYIVTQVLSPILLKISSMKKEWVVHHDRLKPCPHVDLPLWARRRKHALTGCDAQLPSPEPTSNTKADPYCSISVEQIDPLTDPPVYCLCKGIDTGRFMICCDICDEWFHGDCVKVSEKKGLSIDRYVCPICLGN
jgi:transposase InsO family protein